MATWRKHIEEEMELFNDSLDNVVSCNVIKVKRSKKIENDLDWLDIEFDDGYGIIEGFPFLLWTEKRVYFPVYYDGSEWVGSVPRNPDENAIPQHFGGG